MEQTYLRLVQSALAYAAASLITVTLHEFGHGLTALLFGLHPTVYGLHEEDIASSRAAVGVIAAAGPFVSLFGGLIFLVIHRKQQGQKFGRYLTLWLGLLGMATFSGYLMTAPFFREGDVYQVLASAGLAAPVFTGLTCLLGAVCFVRLARASMPLFLALTDSSLPLRPQMMAIGLMAWLIGGTLVLLAVLPQFPFPLILIGTFVPMMHGFAARRDQTLPSGSPGAVLTVSPIGIGLFLALALLEQTLLRRGVHL